MAVLPKWKILRELSRLAQQTKGLVEYFTDPVAQRRLDRLVAQGLPQFEGALPCGEKVVLLLLYQPKGVAESILETCRWFAAAGYAPFIVSNTPLSAQDRARLAPVIWRGVERPNFGYDFGGYRDGLTCLAQWGLRPEELIILNDSVWLPVLPECDLLERFAREPADVAGAILRQRGRERFLESYLYRLRRAALEHPAFGQFWAGLRLTSNKYHVIRRGERGFSAALRAGGLALAPVYAAEDLLAQIAAQEGAFLRKTLEYGAYFESELAAERDAILAGTGPEWRGGALAHIAQVLAKRPAYSSFPYAMVRLMGYPLLKKSAEPISRAWREAHLAAVQAGDLPAPSASVLAEISAR